MLARDPARPSDSEILDRVLDKGIVVDGSIRVAAPVGLEVRGIDVRVVIASAETCLQHADTIAFTFLAFPDSRTYGSGEDDRRVGERRAGQDRRDGPGRRILHGRIGDLPEAVERRTGGDRRGTARRSSAPDRSDRRGTDGRGP